MCSSSVWSDFLEDGLLDVLDGAPRGRWLLSRRVLYLRMRRAILAMLSSMEE